MGALQNLDLLTVGITVGATVILGFTVYITNTKSITNGVFLLFSLTTAVWGVVNYFSYTASDPYIALLLFRGVLCLAVFQALFLYELFLVFPQNTYVFSRRHTHILIPVVLFTAVVTLTPLTFSSIQGALVSGEVAVLHTGPGIALFAVIACLLVCGAIYRLIQKIYSTRGSLRSATLVLLGGVVCMFALIIYFNLVLSVVFLNPKFVPFGAVFTFPFIAAATYAILRDDLFNIKVFGTMILIFLLAIASFTEIIFSNSLPLLLLRAGVFLLILVFGTNLIRGVLREVEQRERIELLAKDLEKANNQQVALIHFITHQLKGFVAKSRNIFSMIQEEEFGPVPEQMKPMISEGFSSSTHGAETIQEILNAANIKSGKMAYNMHEFDLKVLIDQIVSSLQPNATAKNISLTFNEPSDHVLFTGDQLQLENAIKNLIDNSIKYTPKGSITASLTKDANQIRFVIQDTGVGITPEDMQHLFTEGGHGVESQKVNVDSTGFGLYIVRNIIEAHNGKVWAESEGAGKGSRFIVELPVAHG